ncbi:iron-sulfur cluster assembly accessory protein, partial [Agrobacterium rosae]
MGFAVMTMTEAAASRVKAIVENSGPEAKGLRVGIKKGGCAGMEYTIDMVTEPSAKDDLIEFQDAKVWIEPSAVLY